MGSDHPLSRRILVADDEAVNLKVLAAFVRDFGHEAVLAGSGDEALARFDPTIDLALLDVLMPGIDGFEVVRRIRRDPLLKDIPVIMVTALTGREERLAAVEAGANDFIAKPIDKTELKVRMASLLRMKQSQDELKRYQATLEDMVSQRTVALSLALENVQQMQRSVEASQRETIFRLAAAAEYKDDNTASHIRRMSEYSALLGGLAGLGKHEVEVLRHASPMHDVGKMGIPDSILIKPARLTPEEWEIMKTHTLIGRRILQNSDSELLQAAEVIAISHHERWDGTGYPHGVAGPSIPIFGRICAVADVFDALTTPRPYKEAFPNEKALAIMREEQEKGRHFDPALFALFLDNLDGFLNIQAEFQD
ncbi:Cyclic di-GMP phosphodiesterase response regulator RpfG [Fundidesulfovibrio magnetotacticus]|uniref:Cyclic di-GMP phosphodiesterase response regulator RpfG n=1 Tax=Fundidesulfovibrio magnetotacticus TaxID=2730080 RepID=A0A6V8LWY9_9BACT|nr:HD domain-containing phosphohydrolase [Fundidesulfovibrio magnetotacticus]GFK95410.1 Cyclic di-GMP phosphodiesterase response regulator RpfG [Fundidesulfovibrio magnetotacticus]